MTQIIDGKGIANKIREDIAEEVMFLKSKGKTPHLAAILVGLDGASQTYVNNKVKACDQVGIQSSLFRMEDSITEEFLLNKIEELNNDTSVDGILVQLPLPKHISVNKVIESILPEKDVDGFHPINVGRMMKGLPSFISATPLGIMLMLEHLKIPTEGKHCVVVGRSNIVGSPMANLMVQNTYPGNATVTVCHSRTANIEEITKQADILIVAIGKPEFIKRNMVKKGAVIFDVGTTRVDDPSNKKGYRLCGDVDFENVSDLCSYISPVPGGVGPMTITGLLKNTLLSASGAIYSKK